jgi:ADP-heptose:LPS heptosyltransferase
MHFRKHAPANAVLYKFLTRRRKSRLQPYKTLGIYKVDRLGDFVLALGAISACIQHVGVEHCVLFVSSVTEALARSVFPGADIVVLNPNGDKLWRTMLHLASIKSRAFSDGVSTLVCFRHHRSLHEDALIKSIPSDVSIGAVDISLTPIVGELVRGGVRFDKSVDGAIQYVGDCKELSFHRAVAASYLGTPLSRELCLPAFPDIHTSEDNFAVLSPFASDSTRDLPWAHVIEACKWAQTIGLKEVRLLAPSGDMARYSGFARKLSENGFSFITVIQQSSTSDLIRSIANASIVVSADTAPAHIATALDKRLVVLIGGGHPGWFGPWFKSERQIWLTNTLPCFGCNWHCSFPKTLCISDITSDALITALNKCWYLPAA